VHSRVRLINITEQHEKDIESSKATREETRAGIAKLRKELEALNGQLCKSEVRIMPFAKQDSVQCSDCMQESRNNAESKLKEERATLTRFDDELKELERVIKEKKQAIANADLELTKLQHDAQVLAKEKAAAVNFVANLEKQFEWIAEEKEYVGLVLFEYETDDDYRVLGSSGTLGRNMTLRPWMLLG
jgi:structural maintenance of chromosome 2